MRDFDFHPDEDTVRCFGVPAAGVLINDAQSCVMQTRQPDAHATMGEELVLRHFAFADHWFKLNATFDLAGNLIEPGPPGSRYAINCDIATPMVRVGDDISAVDLFLDVLVRVNGDHVVIDRDEFDEAAGAGLISPTEVRGAEAGLIELIDWVESGQLMSLLRDIAPGVAWQAPAPLPFERVPVHTVPSVAPHTRPTW